MSLPQLGEQLAGAYYQIVEDCEMVGYNINTGGQNEMDVLALKTTNEQLTVYACEVATHLDGLDYSREPSGESWNHLDGKRARGNLEKIEWKFQSDLKYVRERFPDADVYKLHFWSPSVPVGDNTKGLKDLVSSLEESNLIEMELLINNQYEEKIDKLREEAEGETTQRGIPAYRILQILEHIR